MNFTIIIKLLGTKNMGSVAYSLYLNEVRKNPTSPDNLLLSSPKGAYCWCSITCVPGYGYASAGDQSTLFAKFPLTSSSGTNLNSFAGPEGEGQDARSNFVRFMQYAG